MRATVSLKSVVLPGNILTRYSILPIQKLLGL